MRRRVTSITVSRTSSTVIDLAHRGNVPEMAEDEATDGVEIAVFGQVRAQSLVDFVDSHAGLNFGRVIVDALDAFDQVLVVFVDDLADDLLQNVLDRDQARHAAEFVQHHGHVIAILLKLLQQFVQTLCLGDEVGGAQQAGNVRSPFLRRFHQLRQQILHVQDADNVVAILVVYRNARMTR